LTLVSAGILGIVSAELLLRLPVADSLKKMAGVARKSLETVKSSEIPEDQKQRLLLGCAWDSFSGTCRLAVWLLSLAAGVATVFWLLARLFAHEPQLIYDPVYLIVATVTAIIYAILRKRFA